MNSQRLFCSQITGVKCCIIDIFTLSYIHYFFFSQRSAYDINYYYEIIVEDWVSYLIILYHEIKIQVLENMGGLQSFGSKL